jgi:bifunctional enzyme CysN/CysC
VTRLAVNRPASEPSSAPHPLRRPGGGTTIWFTGLPGAGKSTIAERLGAALLSGGVPAVRLDGDDLRTGLNADLGFSAADRVENIRRVGEVARLFALAGHTVLVSLISPYRRDRELVRARHSEAGIPFVLVHVSTSLEVCERRDPKGYYARARRGELPFFTGVSDPYEAPTAADVVVDTDGRTPAESTGEVLAALVDMQVVPQLPML